MIQKIIVLCSILCLWTAAAAGAALQFQEGDRGKEITQIQLQLKKQGFYASTIDGRFTEDVTKAVKKFQQSKRLKADGIIDENTYMLLMNKLAPQAGGSYQPSLYRPEAGLPSGQKLVFSGKSGSIIDTALKLQGVPYKWGGITNKGFDCSGFVWYVFDKHTIALPRTADIQYKAGKMVARSNLQQGDLVFFTTYEPGASHCGIYLDNGKFIHASSSKGVMISSLGERYWSSRYLGARRIIG